MSNVQVVFETATPNEFAAWRELARMWGVTLPPGDPCSAAIQHGLRCHRAGGGLEAIRLLDRPSILSLRDPDGQIAFVLLVGVGNNTASLQSGGRTQTVPLDELAGRWHGGFATFWRAPRGYSPTDTSELTDWLQQRFTVLDGAAPAPDALERRIAAFQIANGLQPDGIAGPVTLMKLNRLSNVAEPQLER